VAICARRHGAHFTLLTYAVLNCERLSSMIYDVSGNRIRMGKVLLTF
jgi:hypothetical protein